MTWDQWVFRWASRYMPGANQDRRDMLADARRMFYAGATALSWRELAVRLADMNPDAYAGVTATSAAALLRAEGVRATSVREYGQSVPGCTRFAVDQALARR